uniref:Ig-like domain-containing protein n=1 Tax=Anolis carolinensis TaxID=28377 RepID=A0A803TLN8_ANOCA
NQSLDVVVWVGQPVSLTCSQVKTNNVYMSWYKQERVKDARLQLIILTSEGSTGDPAIEKEFQGRFSSTGMTQYALPLSLKNAQLGDTGTYFCANSYLST